MRVLIADDDAIYRRSLQGVLDQWGYEVVLASNGMEAFNILQGIDPPSIAILDWMMPGMSGIEICSRLRKRKEDPYIYLILITTKSQKSDMIAGLEAEADDYLVKPFDLQELRARLHSGQRIVDMQASLDSRHRELRYRATHDSLTGVWNRSAVLDFANREVGYSIKSKRPLYLALADIDNFKFVNDTYGHAAGDTVLVEVARRMQSALRHYDSLGRYGGEEFIVVMPGINRQRAFAIAERIRMRVADSPYEVAKHRITVTLSIGVATNQGFEGIGPLIRAADEALYRAKAGGRNCVEVSWASNMKEQILPENQAM
jgi:two-component system, cell cycle response regulator